MKNRSLFSLATFTVVTLLTISAFLMLSCSGESSAPLFEQPDATSNFISPNASDIAQVMAVQNRHAAQLEAMDGVFGTATSRDKSGKAVILALVEREDVRGIPANLEGIPVRRLVTDRPELFPKPDKPPGGGGSGGGGGKVDLKARVDRPVPIGYSIGNYNECASGTFGCAVYKGGNIYILSNNHVLARMNSGSNGEIIGQPGLYDNKPQCSGFYSDQIASLSQYVQVQTGTNANNKVDAAIAISSTSDIQCSTPNKFYGQPNSTPVEAAMDMGIQKVGRTSSLTTGTIIGLNATVTLSYAGSNTRFVDQILTSSGFSKSGDSGSLIVTNDASANPVALLFAGNKQGYTWGNRIQNVLSALNVTICGK